MVIVQHVRAAYPGVAPWTFAEASFAGAPPGPGLTIESPCYAGGAVASGVPSGHAPPAAVPQPVEAGWASAADCGDKCCTLQAVRVYKLWVVFSPLVVLFRKRSAVIVPGGIAFGQLYRRAIVVAARGGDIESEEGEPDRGVGGDDGS